VPGVSDVLCGSLVTYRTQTKSDWLAIDREKLLDATHGPVSPWASQQMARAALQNTSEANLVAAVTGHLGPTDNAQLDGVVFVCIAEARFDVLAESEFRLEHVAPPTEKTGSIRAARQQAAAEIVLREIARFA
jgi:nicotinamide mononucleotide (NMN) deamidase PncC